MHKYVATYDAVPGLQNDASNGCTVQMDAQCNAMHNECASAAGGWWDFLSCTCIDAQMQQPRTGPNNLALSIYTPF